MSVANFVADPQYIQQAFATSEPYFARQAGIETRVLLISETGYNPYRVMFTTRDFLKQHPEVIAVRARIAQRVADYLNDPAPAHAVIAKLNPALNPDKYAAVAGSTRPAIYNRGQSQRSTTRQMNSERWTTMYSQLTDLKVIEKAFDPSTAYTLLRRENTIRTAIDPSRRLRIRPYLFWGGNVGKLETEPDTQGTQFAFVEASSSGMRDMLDQRMRSRMQNRIDP